MCLQELNAVDRESARRGIKRFLLIGLLALQPGIVQGAQTSNDPEHDPLAPERAYGIGGVGGFKTISRVEFVGYPDEPHEWTAVYAFPDRARWSLKATSGTPTSPMIVQRLGARSWTIQAGKTESVADDLRGPRTTLIQMELRRALTIWPLGFAWTPTQDGALRAEVFTLQHERDKPPIGHLLASQDQAGTLLGIKALQSNGSPVEELQIKAWREVEGRLWPAETLLVKDGRTVWKESLTYASARGFHSDVLFTPPDRRVSARAEAASKRKPRHIDLPEFTVSLQELEPAIAWTEALKLADSVIQSTQTSLDQAGQTLPRLDTTPAFQLDNAGHPTHLIMRFKTPLWPAPEGWKTLPTRPAVGIVLGGVDALNHDLMQDLRSALPRSAELGMPYCRVLRLGDQTSVQLYQPTAGG